MSLILLKTKLYISPLQPKIVPRTRLVMQLNKSLLGKFTLISAPAGFGKTTLLKEWFGMCDLPVAWVSLDTSDNDPIRFWMYIVAALETIQGDIGKDIFSVLQTPNPPPIESLLAELINEITEKRDSRPKLGDQRFILVLDDYHLITEKKIHNTLTFFLDNLPPQMHLILSSRTDPPWQLARLRARLKMTELRAEDLRFTNQEAAAFLKNVMNLGLAKEDVATLEKRTEGWIVGLQMVALSLQKRKDVSGFIRAFKGTNRFILDYLLEEVLQQQSSPIQDFLLKTSILNQMTSALCDSVLESTGSQKTLTQLEQSNLFLVPLDDERHWYRYHCLFSELLRNQLSQLYPDQLRKLHLRASAWFEDQNSVEAAIQHAFSSKDNERVARLIEKYAQEMLQQSKHSLLSSWIEALPNELVQKRPWLCVYQSWTRHWAGKREGGEDCLNNAEQILNDVPFLSAEEKRILPGYIATVRAHYALINGEIPRVIEQAQKSLQLLPENDHYSRGTTGVALGGAYWGMGEVLNAEGAYRESASSAMKGGYQQRASSALCYQGMMQIRQAKLFKAKETFQRAFELSLGPGGRRFPISGYSLAKLGELAYEWNDLEKAYPDVNDAVMLCTQLGHVDLIAEAYAALVRIQLGQRDFTGAQNTLDQSDQLSRGTLLDPWALCWLDECRLRLWLATDKLDEAIRWIKVSGLNTDDEFSFHHDLHHINLARVLVAQVVQNSSPAIFDEALGLLARLHQTVQTAGWIHKEITVLILQALALYSTGERERATVVLKQALTLSEPEGYVRTLVDEGAPLGELLNNAVTQGIAPSYANRLLAEFEKERRGKLGTPELANPLTTREMEVLRLLTTPLSASEIAAKLVVSVHTVRSHIKSIYSKLGVRSRIQAISQAKDFGLL